MDRSRITTLLVHGVGMWPGLFGPLSDMLDEATVCWVRPGYCGTPAAADLDEQVELLIQAIDEWAPAVVVGVSGGATLGLAAALRHPPGLAAFVGHEPLLGPLAPVLHERVLRSGTLLQGSPDAASVNAFVAGLYGPDTVRGLPGQAHTFIERHIDVIAAEVGDFASFTPSVAELEAIAVPHLTTVGERSPAPRHEVAALLEAAGANRATIDGSGHLVVTDAPERFAARIDEFLAECA